MKEKKFVVVNGIAIGEETKGNTVQAIVRDLNAHTVWRSGGWQGGHHVIHDDGREMAFSFFGAGTFDGAETYLKHMVISPVELFQESIQLEEKGVIRPLDLVTIDQNCLATTPFHSGISRVREILRGPDKKGTVGKGVGEAIKDSIDPDLAIRAGEFWDKSTVLRKIENIRRLKLIQAQELLELESGKIPEQVYPELEILQNQELVELTADAFKITAELVSITDENYLNRLLLREGAIVNEVSHGVLHHPRYGFIPHVTQIDPTSQDVMATLKNQNYDGQLIRLGVVRSYLTRHGAGPLVSFSPELTSALVETHNNAANDWLGDFRTGHFDIVALKYALAIAGGYESFNGLVVSFLDILSQRDSWQVARAYEYQGRADNLEDYFDLEGDKITGIKIQPDVGDEAHYQHQRRLTQHLNNCRPLLDTLTAVSGKSLEQVFIDHVEENLKVPVIGKAYGPKVKDRFFGEKWQQILG